MGSAYVAEDESLHPPVAITTTAVAMLRRLGPACGRAHGPVSYFAL